MDLIFFLSPVYIFQFISFIAMFIYIAIGVSFLMIIIFLIVAHPRKSTVQEDEPESECTTVMVENPVQIKLQSTVHPYVQPPTHAEQFKQNEAIRNKIVNRTTEPWFYKAYAQYDRDPRVHGPDDFDAFKEAVTKYAK